MKRFPAVFLAAALSILILDSNCFASVKISDNPDVTGFINEMAVKDSFSTDELTRMFDKSKVVPEAVTSINHPYEDVSWDVYKKTMVTDERIKSGMDYLHRHEKTLREAYEKYGVPASIIAAIVGVESTYGKEKMRYRVLDTLITLSFYNKNRSDFFRGELEQYLLLCRDMKINPLDVYGSYAGAIGLPQFMPSSYNKYGIAYHPNGKCDLMNDTDDVIMSVAYCLHSFGWCANCPVVRRISGDEFRSGNHANRAENKIIKLNRGKRDEYWIGYHNFSVLEKYNHSDKYVMAVYELARDLKGVY